jgi:putative acetyltransferase
MRLRRLGLAEMDEAAIVHRVAFDERLPWLAGAHSPEEDRRHFREKLFPACTVWGAWDAASLVGIMALRDDWIDQLYVLPHVLPRAQGRVRGPLYCRWPRLPRRACVCGRFQRNRATRRFYEARGFVLIEETDGAANHEKEPDALYRWTR